MIRRTDDSDRRDARDGAIEKFANGFPPAGLTTPVIVAPLLARNETETPATCVLDTVATCVPTVGPSVHRTDARPSALVGVVAADSVPLVVVHANTTPATGRAAASSTCTTSAESSAVARSAD